MMKNTMLEMSRYAALARQAVAEGIVLLKNEAVLPLASGGRAALGQAGTFWQVCGRRF